MGLGEFQLIDRYFTHPPERADVVLGVGDDCALLQPPPGQLLAMTVDAMVEGVHFPLASDPAALGHKALAVSLSDLAAMGAEPAWATLVLSLPVVEEAWVAACAKGLLGLAEQHAVALVGGDTVRGPRALTTQLHGFVPPSLALRRDAARPGDLIYVTGTLGDAGVGLAIVQGALVPGAPPAHAYLRGRLERPTPRVAHGLALRGLAHAAIDISDGLAADLGHILRRSGVGAVLEPDKLPLSAALCQAVPAPADRLRLALTAGDDYELLFTLPEARAEALAERLAALSVGATCIGRIEAQSGLRLLTAAGPTPYDGGGWDHFAPP